MAGALDLLVYVITGGPQNSLKLEKNVIDNAGLIVFDTRAGAHFVRGAHSFGKMRQPNRRKLIRFRSRCLAKYF